jgi:hypothetical protein
MDTGYRDSFPVVAEKRLAPISSGATGERGGLVGGALTRTLVRRRRDPQELPERLPGTQLVFDVDGQYRNFADQGRVKGTERHIVDALAVATVDMRPRMIVIKLDLGSAMSGADFRVRIGFRCRVVDPAVVAQEGLTDLTPVLSAYLHQDRRLHSLTADVVPTKFNEARRRIQSHVTAHCQLNPPASPGMELTLATVEVLPAE